MNLEIRLYQDSDSLAEITDLLHRAYKVLADMGFNYTATNQSAETTRNRLTSGFGYVALSKGAHHLVDYYAKRGYAVKEYIQWGSKTYRSVVMGKNS